MIGSKIEWIWFAGVRLIYFAAVALAIDAGQIETQHHSSGHWPRHSLRAQSELAFHSPNLNLAPGSGSC